MSTELEPSLERVLGYAQGQDYVGFSKFDVLNSPIVERLAGNSAFLRLWLTGAWSRSPVNLRGLLGVRPARNPKGIALFALAHLHRFQRTGDATDRAQCEQLLDWLLHNRSSGFENACWGYDHPWQSVHFWAPRHSPNIVVTGNVAYAFLHAFEAFGDERYLDVARGVARFMLEDLETPFSDERMRSISYVPGNRAPVLNINGLAGVILLRVGLLTGEQQLLDEARRLITFLVDKQTDYGGWHYAWPAGTSHVKHDNYHTGNVLDWVLEYNVRSEDESFRDAFDLGLQFYEEHLFAPGGRPKWRSDKEYPADVHSAAQAVVTFSKTARWVDRRTLDHAHRTAEWAIRDMQKADGSFCYQRGRFLKKRFTLMRWCNAWMAYATSLLMLAQFEATEAQPRSTEATL